MFKFFIVVFIFLFVLSEIHLLIAHFFVVQMVDIQENLALFVELQTLGDRTLRKLTFSHVIHSIKRMNQKHKNEAKNRALQKILFVLLQVKYTFQFLHIRTFGMTWMHGKL